MYAEEPERTAMDTGEKHLFDVGHWLGSFIGVNGPVVWNVLDTTFVKGQRMAEV